MTQKQLQLIKLINNYKQTTGEAPTYTEMKKAIGVTSNQTVSDHLDALERSGLIKRLEGKKRGIKLTASAIRVLALQDKRQKLPVQHFDNGLSVVSEQYLGSLLGGTNTTTNHFGGNITYVTDNWNHQSPRSSSSG